MKKVTLYIAQSLDGFVARKDHNVSWLDEYDDVDFRDYAYDVFMENIDTVVQGATTYDLFKPTYPGKKSYVFSYNADKRDKADTIFVNADVQQFMNALDETHQHIWLVGGPNLLAQFLQAGLVNEVIIFTMPVLLQKGIRLFDQVSMESKISLINTEQFNKSIVMSHYRIT